MKGEGLPGRGVYTVEEAIRTRALLTLLPEWRASSGRIRTRVDHI